MFRCDNCGGGYTARMASSWDCCPRCLAKSKINVPLKFELGWHSGAHERGPSAGKLGPHADYPAPGEDAAQGLEATAPD